MGICTGVANKKTCQCMNGYFDDNGETLNGTCVAKIALWTTCPDPVITGVTPTDPCADSNAECRNYEDGFKCNCTDLFYENKGQCIAKVELGSGCTTSAACIKENADCLGGMCSCWPGFYDSNGDKKGGNCISKVNLGSPCPRPDACGTSFAVCSSNTGDGICVCGPGYYEHNGDTSAGFCIQEVSLGYKCTTHNECQKPLSVCNNGKCECEDGYYDSNGPRTVGGICEPDIELGNSCPRTDTCMYNNTVCKGGICTCVPDYYDINGQNKTGGICEKKVDLGGQCSMPDTCGTDNAVCSNDSIGGTCICNTSYYDSNNVSAGGTCEPKVHLGISCTMPDACIAANSECIGGLCQCRSNFYNSRTRSCVKKKHIQCGWAAQCVDANAECTRNVYTCTCKAGYILEGMVCIAVNPLGKLCSRKTDCSDRNAECVGSMCVCGDQFYDSNGFESGGNCEPISNLQVTGVIFSAVSTTSFTVHWTLPSASQYIDVLLVAWNAVSHSEKGFLAFSGSAQTNVTIATNITAGRAYTVSVISRNNRTHSIDYRQTNVTRMQGAKPLPVQGPLDKFDLDVTDRRRGIAFLWQPISYHGVHEVTLMDGSVQIQKISTTQNNCTLYHTSMLAGHRYNVTIVSRSELFKLDNNQNTYVTSEPYREAIKTIVTRPSAPVDPRCQSNDSYSIILTWSPPILPNGDLVGYHVELFESLQGVVLRRQTVKAPLTYHAVQNLIPGHMYNFKISTENEEYVSEPVTLTRCITPIAKSGEPHSLTISVVTSRSMTMFWEYPKRTNSEEIYGYILQIRDTADTCVYKQLFKCSECIMFKESFFGDALCPEDVRGPDKIISKQELSERITITASSGLLPYTDYIISVAAVNGRGQGKNTTLHQRTDEEEPHVLNNVGVTDIQVSSMVVYWNLGGFRPGRVNYMIKLIADDPAESPVVIIQGFEKNNVVVWDLQEHWGYRVAVTTSTSKGNKTKTLARKYFTKPAPPGAVDAFIVEPIDGDYTKAQISWKIPTILERNSNITGYMFKHNVSDTETSKLITSKAESFVYTEIVLVDIGKVYAFKVNAVNDYGQNGIMTELIYAPVEETPKESVTGTNLGIVIGGASGALVVVGVVVLSIVCLVKRRKTTYKGDNTIGLTINRESDNVDGITSAWLNSTYDVINSSEL